jgi:integrase
MTAMDSDPTLNDYFDEWFALLRTQVQPTTWRGYHDMVHIYLLPTLGRTRLRELHVRQLNRLYVHLLEQGGRRGGRLALRTVRYAHAVLRKALLDAVAVGLLEDNVADQATLPRVDAHAGVTAALHVWDADQAQRFLALTAGEPMHDLWRVALGTGMRRGELLGLRWQDVDLAVPQVRVTTSLAFIDGRPHLKTTKTGRSRVLHLDEDTAAAIDRQPRHEHAPLPLVFTEPSGAPLRPENITGRWRSQWPRLQLPRIRLHDTRHCHATLLLSEGVPIKVVSERLGHTTIAMTMDIYAHVLPAMDRDAAAAIARALGGPSC